MAWRNYFGANFKAQKAKALISLSNKSPIISLWICLLYNFDFIRKEGTKFKLKLFAEKGHCFFFSMIPIGLNWDRNINLLI